MIAIVIWFVLCTIMGIQAGNVLLAWGFWLFTIGFVALSMSGGRHRSSSEEQDIYYRKLRQKRKEEKESKKGTIEFEIKR